MFLTWRDDSAFDIAGPSLVNRLASVCAEHGALLVQGALQCHTRRRQRWLCVHLPPGRPQCLHGFCDILITDYSSVALDFLLLGRPILLHVTRPGALPLEAGLLLRSVASPWDNHTHSGITGRGLKGCWEHHAHCLRTPESTPFVLASGVTMTAAPATAVASELPRYRPRLRDYEDH
jgi:hypothetical protein